MLKLPAAERSLWRDSYPASSVYPMLTKDLVVDAAIVGAGITGLTTAYLLKRSGLKVAVLDKDTVGGGTSGRTTGKVTSQHNITYHDLRQNLDTETARLYGEANQAAVAQVEFIIKAEGIDCDWVAQDNYVYTAEASQVEKFRQEAETARNLGLPASFETNSPLPFGIKAAVKFSGQARMNAQKYVLGLASAVDGSGSRVFEHSNVIRIRDGKYIKTSWATARARHIIVATNVPTWPLLARGSYCVAEYPTESYIVAGKLPRPLEGMYISPDEHHYSILPVRMNEEDVILIGGEGHISGRRLSKQKRFQKLADYAQGHFGVTEITHAWSDRDYSAYDKLPLIGKMYPWSKNLYVATAFNKWGLSNGTMSAMILHDLITGKDNSWADKFSPHRLSAPASIPQAFISHIK